MPLHSDHRAVSVATAWRLEFLPLTWQHSQVAVSIIHEFYPSFVSKHVVHHKEEQDGAQTSPLWHAPHAHGTSRSVIILSHSHPLLPVMEKSNHP